MSETTKIKDKRETKKEKNKWTNKYRNEQGGTEAIVKGRELNDIVVHLS